MKRAFKVKKTPFFLVSQVLSFGLIKQTSKDVADTTFKALPWINPLFGNCTYINGQSKFLIF